MEAINIVGYQLLQKLFNHQLKDVIEKKSHSQKLLQTLSRFLLVAIQTILKSQQLFQKKISKSDSQKKNIPAENPHSANSFYPKQVASQALN